MPERAACQRCLGMDERDAGLCPRCGRPNPSQDELWREARAFLNKLEFVEAFKLVRERTGWDLRECKAYIDARSEWERQGGA